MSSEFTQLCEMFGLSPGDPDAIDIIIEECNKPVSEDDDDYDHLDHFEEFYYEEDELDEDDLDDD